MPALVDQDTCISCEACVGTCPVETISMVDVNNEKKAEVGDACIDCGQCVEICPVDAIEIK